MRGTSAPILAPPITPVSDTLPALGVVLLSARRAARGNFADRDSRRSSWG
jgi:hypothetical protein